MNDRLMGLMPEEKVVYEAIKQKGNEGLWVKDLRSVFNTPQLTKLLKNLESRKLIKAVKSVEVSIRGNPFPSREFPSFFLIIIIE
jgi:hypothetical protein